MISVAMISMNEEEAVGRVIGDIRALQTMSTKSSWWIATAIPRLRLLSNFGHA